MACLELYPTRATRAPSLLQTDTRTKVSISSLLNPEPVQPSLNTPSTYHQPWGTVQNVDSFYEFNGYERQRRARGASRPHKKYPYPYERARQIRRSSVCFTGDVTRESRLSEPSKHVRISLDAYLDGADLEKQALRSRAEWLKAQANRVEAPRPLQHSNTEIMALARWLVDILCDVLLDEQTESGRAIIAKELRGDIRALLGSCINPPTSTVLLALWYIRKLFPFPLRVRQYSSHDCAKIVFRAFCIAMLFAFKWLDDFAHCIGSTIPPTEVEYWRRKRENPKKYRTCWADFMAMSVAEVNNLELCALAVLDWNIAIFTPEWYFWLDELHDYTLSRLNSSSYTIVAELISAAQEELERKSPDAPFMNTPSRTNAATSSLEPIHRLERALLVGILVPQSWCPVLLEIPQQDASAWISPTAELRCSEDEIVRRSMKGIGPVPGESYNFPSTRVENGDCSWSSRFHNTDSSENLTRRGDIRAQANLHFEPPMYSHPPCHELTLTPVFLNPGWGTWGTSQC